MQRNETTMYGWVLGMNELGCTIKKLTHEFAFVDVPEEVYIDKEKLKRMAQGTRLLTGLGLKVKIK